MWNAFAEVLRANSRGMDGMMQTQAAMGQLAGAAATPLQRVDVGERALASRLESVRKLKAALVPLYQLFEGAQKQAADKLLMPPMIGDHVVEAAREPIPMSSEAQQRSHHHGTTEDPARSWHSKAAIALTTPFVVAAVSLESATRIFGMYPSLRSPDAERLAGVDTETVN